MVLFNDNLFTLVSMKPRHLFILLICVFFSACHSNDKKALDDLLKRHPDIYTEKHLKQYVVLRSLFVTYPDTVRLTLFGVQSSMDDSKIVMISGKDSNTYAVPLPNNNNYWASYGKSNDNFARSSFNDEMYTALKTIGIKNNNDAGLLIDDIFTSLLRWEREKIPDTSFVKKRGTGPLDSCTNIMLGNMRMMFNMSKHYGNENRDGLFLDRENGRYIQLTSYYNDLSNGLTVKIYTYQIPCIMKL